MADFAIAISVYDKFRDVRLLCDILRSNWEGRFDIVVCSSHPDAPAQLAGCDIDEILTPSMIPIAGSPVDDERVSPRARLWVRVLESVRAACGRCAERNRARFTLHVHADACPLSWPKLRDLAGEMVRLGKGFAARGEGFGFYTWNEPVGAFDDMFFVVDNEVARSRGLWQFDPFDFLPHKISIHGALAILALTRIGMRGVHHYATPAQAVYWDGKPVFQHPLNASHPMYFDPAHAFLHIHETGFPGDLGIRLKALFLARHGVTRGRNVEAFLAEWLTPEADLLARLAAGEKRLRQFFLRKGLSPAEHGRNFDIMAGIERRYRDMSMAGRTSWLAGMHLHQAKALVSGSIRRAAMKGRIFRDRYPDTIWPERLDDLYAATFGVREGSFSLDG